MAAAYSYNGSFSSLLRNYHPYPPSQRDINQAASGGPPAFKKQEGKKAVQPKTIKLQGWMTGPKEEPFDEECGLNDWLTSIKSSSRDISASKDTPYGTPSITPNASFTSIASASISAPLKSGSKLFTPRGPHQNWSSDYRCTTATTDLAQGSLNKLYIARTPPIQKAHERRLARGPDGKTIILLSETRSAPPAAAYYGGGKAAAESGVVSTNPFGAGKNGSNGTKAGSGAGSKGLSRLTRSTTNVPGRPHVFKLTSTIVNKDAHIAAGVSPPPAGFPASLETTSSSNQPTTIGSNSKSSGNGDSSIGKGGVNSGSTPTMVTMQQHNGSVPIYLATDGRSETIALRGPLSRMSNYSTVEGGPKFEQFKRQVTMQLSVDENSTSIEKSDTKRGYGGSVVGTRGPSNVSNNTNTLIAVGEQGSAMMPEIMTGEIVLKSRAEQINYIHSRINALESELTRSRLLSAATGFPNGIFSDPARSSVTAASSLRPGNSISTVGSLGMGNGNGSTTGTTSAMSHHRVMAATPSSIRQATTKLLSYNRKYCLGTFPASKYGYKGGDSTSDDSSGVDNAAFSKPTTPPRLKMVKKGKEERLGARSVLPSKISVQEAIPDIGMSWKFQKFHDAGPSEPAVAAAKMKLF